MTAEEKVKAKWPDAFAANDMPGHYGWSIWAGGSYIKRLSGYCQTEANAWKNAARRIGPDRGGER